MNRLNTSRTTWVGATAAAMLALSTGTALADNTAPTTPAQPNQQQTGVTETESQQPAANANTTSSTSTTAKGPTRVWTKRAERGEATHRRGMSK